MYFMIKKIYIIWLNLSKVIIKIKGKDLYQILEERKNL